MKKKKDWIQNSEFITIKPALTKEKHNQKNHACKKLRNNIRVKKNSASESSCIHLYSSCFSSPTYLLFQFHSLLEKTDIPFIKLLQYQLLLEFPYVCYSLNAIKSCSLPHADIICRKLLNGLAPRSALQMSACSACVQICVANWHITNERLYLSIYKLRRTFGSDQHLCL